MPKTSFSNEIEMTIELIDNTMDDYEKEHIGWFSVFSDFVPEETTIRFAKYMALSQIRDAMVQLLREEPK